MHVCEEAMSTIPPSLFMALTGAEVMEDQVTTAFTALLQSQKVPLLPRDIALTKGQTILDILCGEGEWVNRLGFELDDPTREEADGSVVGIDFRPHRIAHAQAQARARHLANVSFSVEDIYHLTFPDNSFDLVHLRGLAFCVPEALYPVVLTEAHRVLRPGGRVICTEFAWPRTTALSGLMLADQIRKMLAVIGYVSIRVECLRDLLFDVGFQGVRARSISIDLSAGTEENWLLVHRFFPLLYFLPPIMTKREVMPELQMYKLVQDLEAEVRMPTFRAEWPLVTTIGEKSLDTGGPLMKPAR